MEPITMIFLGVLAIIILYIIFSSLVVVPQTMEYIVEFLGKYRTTWKAGIHLKIPFFERIVNRVTTKESIIDSKPQDVITKDNVSMKIDTVVYFRIFDSNLYTYGASNPLAALDNLTATTLRNIVGELELDETLTSRDTVNGKMTQILDEATDKWGIKVTRVELKNIIPPRDIQDSMEKEMKAERQRRQTLLEAEGHRQAVITRAEGDKQAAILQAEGERDARIARAQGEAEAVRLAKEAEAAGITLLCQANPTPAVLELRRYDTLAKMADGKASKIIVPTDVVESSKKQVLFSELTGVGDVTRPAADPEPEVPADTCCDVLDEDDSYLTKSILEEKAQTAEEADE